MKYLLRVVSSIFAGVITTFIFFLFIFPRSYTHSPGVKWTILGESTFYVMYGLVLASITALVYPWLPELRVKRLRLKLLLLVFLMGLITPVYLHFIYEYQSPESCLDICIFPKSFELLSVTIKALVVGVVAMGIMSVFGHLYLRIWYKIVGNQKIS